MRGRGVLAAVAVLASATPAAAAAEMPIGPVELRPASFGVRGPVTTTVEGVDGDRIHVDTWLPAPAAGATPPDRVPVVMAYSPYFDPGKPGSRALELLVRRGYAFAQAHVPGTGGSTGCFAQGGAVEQADGARVVAHLARAPYSDGNVGLFGMSYVGGTALEVAASPERELVDAVDAVVALSPVAGLYEFFFHDGVPHFGQSAISTGYDFVINGFESGSQGAAADLRGRLECQDEQLPAVLDESGDLSAFYRQRDLGRQVRRIDAPVFMTHGHGDRRVSSHVQAGLFDRLDVPRTGLFGVWGHVHPPVPAFEPMLVAWLDHWLMGADNGVARWPGAQVQATDGGWHARRRWPRLRRRSALRLGTGTLGADAPGGASTYVEGAGSVTFTSAPQPERLELVGMPVLDAWVTLDAPDAHLAAELEALGPDGERTRAEARVIGLRSMRHLDPYVRGRFAQERGVPAPVGRPVRVRIRFDPTDLVVPPGGRLRLELSGSVASWDGLEGAIDGGEAVLPGPSQPSPAAARVTVLHDPAHPSALRFRRRPPRG